MSTTVTVTLDELFEGRSGAIPRDLKLNLKRTIENGALAPDEAFLTVSALAAALDLPQLARYSAASLESLGVSAAEIGESVENAAIMGMLNTYYRFKHLTEHGDDYRSAGLRMTVFSNPALGRIRFEMLAFAVSVLNGCESCIRSHEQVLRDGGVTVDKIHDLVRLASIMKGVRALNLQTA